MSPGDPCPGPSCTPNLPFQAQPVSADVIQGAVERGSVLYGQMIAKFLGAVQAAASEGVSTVTGLLGKFDGAVSAGRAAGQSVIDGLAANFNMSVQSQIPPQPPDGPGATCFGGACVDQYAYNLYQYGTPPYEIIIEPRGVPPAIDQNHPLCFVAGYDTVYDAVTYVNTHSGSPPPVNCPHLGGPVGGQTVPCETNLWQAYQLYAATPSGQQLIGCTIRCSTDPAPPGGVALGNPVSYDIALGLLQTSACAIGPPTPGGTTGTTFNAGCDSQKQPVVWDSSQPAPAGVTNTIGPFVTQAAALSAATVICQALSGPGGTGGPCPPTQVTCPAPVVNVSCPPGTGGTTGPPSGTGSINFPDCLKIDLCDWDKFKEVLTDALCDWYKTCVCKLDNEAAYMTADCDDQFTSQMRDWFGGIGGQVIGQSSMDDLVTAGRGSFHGDPLPQEVLDPW